jgi:hypothetical protein
MSGAMFVVRPPQFVGRRNPAVLGRGRRCKLTSARCVGACRLTSARCVASERASLRASSRWVASARCERTSSRCERVVVALRASELSLRASSRCVASARCERASSRCERVVVALRASELLLRASYRCVASAVPSSSGDRVCVYGLVV